MKPAIVWSEAALRLFDLRTHTAVSAGAGSGKTTCLVELCLRLFSGEATGSPCEPAEVVAITFTEKAAAELEERLREGLLARAGEALARGDGAAAQLWRSRLDSLPRMAVGTIHGFAARLLREHALEAGVDPEFEVLDEERAQAWRQEAALGAVVAALDAGRPVTRLLAAAHGAGGTRGGLAGAVVDLLRERASLGDTLPLVPSPDRLAEAVSARERAVSAAAALLAGQALARTASGSAALARLAEAVASLPPAGSLSTAHLAAVQRLAAATSGWRAGKGDGAGARAAREELAEAVETFALLAAETLARPQKREVCALVADAEVRYRARRQWERCLDFDDLLLLARDLLRHPALRAGLRRGMRALLVDEYQDVNGLQQELFELLAGPDPAGESPASESATSEGPGSPLLVAVGDLKQSIYRFRGADVAVFRGVLEQLGRDGAAARQGSHRAGQGKTPGLAAPGRVLHLAQNHRSCPGVLELVNEVSERCMRPPGPEARPYELHFRPEDRLMAVRPEAGRPACELLVDGVASGDAGERRLREARAIAGRIAALVSGRAGVSVRERARVGGAAAQGDEAGLGRGRGAGPAQGGEAGRAHDGSEQAPRLGGPAPAEEARLPRLGDIALLFRRLTQVGPYERALREAGIPCRLARGGGFFRAPEVRDLGELLRTLTAPDDCLAWAALLRSPLCGVGEGALLALGRVGLERLATLEPEEAVRELLRLDSEVAKAWPEPGCGSSEAARLGAFLAAWRALRDRVGRLPVAELLELAVERLNLEAAHLAAPDGERRLANLRKALALAARHDAAGGDAAGLALRLRSLSTQPPREPEAELEPGDAVALLSIHQAKGLEWPVVFLPDLGATPPADGRRFLRNPLGALAVAFHDEEADRFHPTAALEAAREEARRAGAAEARRLLYVAMTRARDRLVLSGEARRGESFRTLVEAGLEERPDLVERIAFDDVAGRLAESGDAPLTPTVSPLARGEGDPDAGAGRAGESGDAELHAALSPPFRPPAVRLAVTALAEYARCPRRVYLGRHLGLTERGPGGAAAEADPEHATAQGTLAHALLAEIDLDAPPLERRAQLLAATKRRGEDARAPGTRRILGDVARFLDSPAGRRLAGASRRRALRREVPFLLRLGGEGEPTCYLSGAVDALVEEGSAVELVDYKYAFPRPGAAERYRLQLLVYALAAGRARPGARVRATLQFLRGRCAAVNLSPSTVELRRFAREAPALASSAVRGDALRSEPVALGRDEARCRAEGCGFVYRCYPGDRGGHW